MVDASLAPVIRQADTKIGWSERFGALRMRLGIGRGNYRVEPGLYRLGAPGRQSPVLVTANYKLTFDVLRAALAGRDVWLLVLDTKGINVWCAAGKQTFGTREVCSRIIEAQLYDLVDHRKVVLPQLGASGVAAHEVQAFTEFRVIYGPVRAADIPAFLDAGMKASPEMRRVMFGMKDRLVLTGVELSVAWKPKVLAGMALVAALSGLGVWGYSASAAVARGAVALIAALAGLLAGAFVMPALLPWLPFRAFSAKGALVAAPFALALSVAAAPIVGWTASGAAGLALVAIASYAAMNFTGTSTFTSPSGVQYEMTRALPWQIGAAALAIVLWAASAFVSRGW